MSNSIARKYGRSTADEIYEIMQDYSEGQNWKVSEYQGYYATVAQALGIKNMKAK